MQDLEPPEVPLELIPEQAAMPAPKKEGFFKRLFSKKSSDESNVSSLNNSSSLNTDSAVIDATSSNNSGNLPKLELPTFELSSLDQTSSESSVDPNSISMPDFSNINSVDNTSNNSIDSLLSSGSGTFPEMPRFSSISEPSVNSDKSNSKQLAGGKSKGKAKKGTNRDLGKIDESSKFDWSREITDQEILIHDSNRFNQDVNLLISQANQHVDSKVELTDDDNFSSSHNEVSPNLEPLDISKLQLPISRPSFDSDSEESSESTADMSMPLLDLNQRSQFVKITASHQKLRKTLERYLKTPKLFKNKSKVLELFKAYDTSIESTIKEKELELSRKKQSLLRHEKHLASQDEDLKKMQSYMTELDKKLKARESDINKVVADAVEKDLSKRLKTDKTVLRAELDKTEKLNNDLKKKVKILEDDRIRFEAEHQKMSDLEKKKLVELQVVYEKKLQELDSERKEFESKRKAAMDLLKRADLVSKELAELQRLKTYLDSNRTVVSKELSEDKELKQALERAELALSQEKTNLDNMVFSKYIDTKLKSIKPEYLQKRTDWKTELQSNPLYTQIAQCRVALSTDLVSAKSMYNSIRKSYETMTLSSKEREALYTAIRDLYNDIQLKIVDSQLHPTQ